MKTRLWTCWLLTVVVVTSSWRDAAAQEKPPRLTLTQTEIDAALTTDWFGVYMVGKKVGYARIEFTRLADPKNPAYVASMHMHMTIGAVGEKQEIKMDERFEFDSAAPFALRRGNLTENFSGAVKKKELIRGDKGFTGIITGDGITTKRQLGAIDYTLSDELMARVWIQRKPNVGDRLLSHTYDFDKFKLDPETRKLLSTKTSLAEGVKVTYHEVEMTSPKLQVPMLERYNAKGLLLSGKIADVIELRAEPEQQAKDIGQGTDLFVLGSVKIDRPIGEATRVAELVIEIVGKEGAVFKSGARQTITRTPAGTYVCKVGKPHGAPATATDAEVKESLEETEMYPVKHPRVQALAKEALGEAKTPKDKVAKLVTFVHRYISGDYKVRPHSVLQLLDVRKGACTEYALLFTTLARAAGVPAREVTGLYYLGDDEKAFGPHAWSEVVLDGEWVPVDPAWGETETDAAHLTIGSAKGDRELNLMVDFLSTFGKVSFKLVEVKLCGCP
jgi:hypothetical protein